MKLSRIILLLSAVFASKLKYQPKGPFHEECQVQYDIKFSCLTSFLQGWILSDKAGSIEAENCQDQSRSSSNRALDRALKILLKPTKSDN